MFNALAPHLMFSPRSILGLLTVLSLASTCLADGKFFGPVDIVDPPEIESQRAVISFRDGVETLIVQSDLSGSGSGGDTIGWVLPLPAAPSEIEACHPNALAPLNRLIAPHVVQRSSGILVWGVLLLMAMLVICANAMARARGESVPLVLTLGMLLLIAMVGVLFMPSLGVRGRVSAGVDLIAAKRVGVYNVSVIQSRRGADVSDWLTSNGFASPPAVSSVISDYASDGWCFLTAKVAPSEGKGVTHHPLRVSFPIESPVYPMRLTGVDAEPILLDLYVIGEKRARSDVLDTWVCDRFVRNEKYGVFHNIVATAPDVYDGRETRHRIGLADISRVMWDDCVLTRLRGSLSPGQMQRDITIEWQEPEPFLAVFHTRKAALWMSAGIAVIVWAVLIGVGTSAAVRHSWTQAELMRRRVWPGLVVALVIGGIRYSTLGVVDTTPAGRAWYRELISTRAHRDAVEQLRDEPPGDDFATHYRKLLEDNDRGDAEGKQAVSDLTDPGDYSIQRTEGGWLLTVLDKDWIPTTVPISSNGAPQSRNH